MLAESGRGARAQVGADHSGTQVVELRRHDPSVDPSSHRFDEPREPGVGAEAEERRLSTEAAGVVELLDGVGDRQRVGWVLEVHLAVRLEVRGRLTVGDDQQYRLGARVLAEEAVGEEQRVVQVRALVPHRVEAGELLDVHDLGVATEADQL